MLQKHDVRSLNIFYCTNRQIPPERYLPVFISSNFPFVAKFVDSFGEFTHIGVGSAVRELDKLSKAV